MIDGSQRNHPSDLIPLAVPEIAGNEWQYVKECLDTGWVSSVGAYVDRFEQATAQRLGIPHAIATASGTAALHVALLAAGVQADDEVLVSDLTFIAPVNAIRYLGAHPVLVDAEPDYWQIDVEHVRRFLERECTVEHGTLRNRHSGRRVSALLPVDILGHPVDMDPLRELASRFGLPIIEDATESLGARYWGRPVGSDTTIACISFNGNKIITTGGGGMIVTSDAAMARRCRYLSTQAKDDAIEFVHGEVGFNYRLSNVLAAIGCAQLEELDRIVESKRRTAHRYMDALAEIPGLTCNREAEWAFSTFWMFTVLVDDAAFGMDRRALIRALGERNIQARPLWQPMHLSPAHCGARVLGGAVAAWLNRCAISLPCSAGLTDPQQDRVIGELRRLAR